jgi:hypothetical protein
MKITERQLRTTIRQILEASKDPNMPTSIGGRLMPQAADSAMDYAASHLPGASAVKSAYNAAQTARDAMTDSDLSKKYKGQQIPGFFRACREFEPEIRNIHRSENFIDVAHMFNEILKRNGVTRYYLVTDDPNHAGEFAPADVDIDYGPGFEEDTDFEDLD